MANVLKNIAGALSLGALVLSCLSLPSNAQTAPRRPAAMPGMPGMVNPKNASQPTIFGLTDNFDGGALTQDEYLLSYYCDTSVQAGSTSGCEVGTTFMVPPAQQFDPIYITVPLGFTEPQMQLQCPNGIVCVDHPATIDLSQIGGPSNAATPGHDHFTTTEFGGNPEWWDVLVIGVKNKQTFDLIAYHKSFAYLQHLIKSKNPNVTAPIPTNLFLYFAVRQI